MACERGLPSRAVAYEEQRRWLRLAEQLLDEAERGPELLADMAAMMSTRSPGYQLMERYYRALDRAAKSVQTLTSAEIVALLDAYVRALGKYAAIAPRPALERVEAERREAVLAFVHVLAETLTALRPMYRDDPAFQLARNHPLARRLAMRVRWAVALEDGGGLLDENPIKRERVHRAACAVIAAINARSGKIRRAKGRGPSITMARGIAGEVLGITPRTLIDWDKGTS